MKPPTMAPAIPSRIVTTKPPGSFPGITSFAIAPTTSPKMIQLMMCITFPQHVQLVKVLAFAVLLPNSADLRRVRHPAGTTFTIANGQLDRYSNQQVSVD